MSQKSRLLLVTENPSLLDNILRLAAAADVEMEVAHATAHARGSWNTAPIVLVGADLAGEMASAKPSRRDGVVLVGEHAADAETWQRAVALGVEQVALLPEAESWLVERLADAAEEPTTRALTLCVIGGRGGAGTSTLAAALALTGSRNGWRSLLVDGDPLGGGIDLVLGGEGSPGARWSHFTRTRGRVSGDALRGALPRVDDLAVLSCDREPGNEAQLIPVTAMRSVLAAARRVNELVVVDLPRFPDEAAEATLACCTQALLLVPAEVRATVAAARVAGYVSRHAADLGVVVRGPAPAGLSAEVIAGSLGLPLLGQVRAVSGLAAGMERGEGPTRGGSGPLARFCASYLRSTSAGVAA